MGICIAKKLHEPPIILYCEKKCEKYVENNNMGKLWKNCEKNSVEKNSMGKVWKILTHGNSENHPGDNVLKG